MKPEEPKLCKSAKAFNNLFSENVKCNDEFGHFETRGTQIVQINKSIQQFYVKMQNAVANLAILQPKEPKFAKLAMAFNIFFKQCRMP